MSWKHTGSLDGFIVHCLKMRRYRAVETGNIINTNFRGTGRERQLAEWPDARGYLMCEMWDGSRRATAMVHRVVCIAFHGAPPNDRVYDVNHIDGIKSDNRPVNLEWSTQSNNCVHALKTGLRDIAPHIGLKGESHHMAKLTSSDIAEIFRLRKAGKLQREIAVLFGLSQSYVSEILLGKVWRHLNGEKI